LAGAGGEADGDETRLAVVVERLYIAHLENFLKREARFVDWEELGEKVLDALRRGRRPLDRKMFQKIRRKVSARLRAELDKLMGE